MAVKSKKINVNSLIKGMYISGLDRPWIETSFPIEGFYLENDQDIAQISKQCNFVYIDEDLSKLKVDLQFFDFDNAARPSSLHISSTVQMSKQPEPAKSQTNSTVSKLKRNKSLYIERVPF